MSVIESFTSLRSWLSCSILLLFAGELQAGELPTHTDVVRAWVTGAVDPLVELYKQLHAAPELSFQERETAARIAGELTASGFSVTSGVGGHGVVGILKNGQGPTIMLRCDMDALPVTEETELVYASRTEVELPAGGKTGVMHACGHDIHMTNAIGAARFMAAHQDLWSGTLMVIGQPAEEKGAGAKAMLEDKLFERFPRPDSAIALHVDPTLATGKIGFRSGFAMANVDSVDITMQGKGGHGAYPHTTIDPVVQAAHLVLDLQTIVSREIQPSEPAVITVGSIHGGTKHNIIGESCHLELTVRSYGSETRAQLLAAIERKAKAVAQSHAAPKPRISISEGTPSLFNNEDLAARIVRPLRQVLGDDQVLPVEPSMGGEDFSRYGKAGVPIFMFRLGSVEATRLDRFEQLGQDPPSLHSPKFYPDPAPTLTTGLTVTITALLELLQPGSTAGTP